jgi:hypothetical protein
MKIKKNGQIFTLTESDLKRIFNKVKLNEQEFIEPKQNKELNACVRNVVGEKNIESVMEIIMGDWDVVKLTTLMVSLFDPFSAAGKADGISKCYNKWVESGGEPNVKY